MRSMETIRHRGSRVMLPLGVMLFAALAAACGGGSGGAKDASAQAIVARAAAATDSQKRFHFVFDEKNGPRSTSGVHLVFAEGDVIVPDKVQADVSGTFLGLPLRSRLIAVAGKYYLNDPFTGKWRQVSIKANPVAFFDPAKGVLAVIKGATQLELLGSEPVGGADAYHLRGKTSVRSITPLLGNPPGARLVDVELWIDEKTDRLVRLRLAGRVEGGDPAGAARTIELSRFGAVVPIVAPRAGT